jgi:hypothetical protein
LLSLSPLLCSIFCPVKNRRQNRLTSLYIVLCFWMEGKVTSVMSIYMCRK